MTIVQMIQAIRRSLFFKMKAGWERLIWVKSKLDPYLTILAIGFLSYLVFSSKMHLLELLKHLLIARAFHKF